MASPKPHDFYSVMSRSEESSVVQVLDSDEPLVTASSSDNLSVEMLDSSEPLVDPLLVPETSPPPVPPPVSMLPPSLDDSEGSHASGTSGRRAAYNAGEIRSQWNLKKIGCKLASHQQCIKFAEERGLVPKEKKCLYHRRPMSLKTGECTGQLGIFRCTKSTCRSKKVSRAKGTWFENARLPLETIFTLMYLFAHKSDFNTAQRETANCCGDDDTILSTKTIADWYSYCREAIVLYELENSEAQDKMGGPGKIVQISGTELGKRKYDRGGHIEGHWVLGMIENGKDDLRLEVIPDNDRSSEILLPLIQKHVEERQ